MSCLLVLKNLGVNREIILHRLQFGTGLGMLKVKTGISLVKVGPKIVWVVVVWR